MSILGEQIKELREAARQFEGYQNGEISSLLREAADTIESLRDRLQELQGVGGESRYYELFGTPERAARMLSPDDMSCKWCLLHDYCKDECLIEEHGRLLEWLESEVRDD